MHSPSQSLPSRQSLPESLVLQMQDGAGSMPCTALSPWQASHPSWVVGRGVGGSLGDRGAKRVFDVNSGTAARSEPGCWSVDPSGAELHPAITVKNPMLDAILRPIERARRVGMGSSLVRNLNLYGTDEFRLKWKS